jgi:hypothetical protein
VGVYGEDETELVRLALEVADLPGAAEAVGLADTFPLPAVEEVALVVPDRSGFDLVISLVIRDHSRPYNAVH